MNENHKFIILNQKEISLKRINYVFWN